MANNIHSMPEGLITRPTQTAWGCTNSPAWVPYPKKAARRHALIDAVSRIDDPCARPVYKPPDWAAKPAFSAVQEGYPNAVCDLKDYSDLKEMGQLPEGAALINVGKDTPKAVELRIPAIYMDQTSPDSPSADQCCDEGRNLDPTRKRYEEIMMKNNPPGSPPVGGGIGECVPNNPDYPCSGVICELIREPLVPPPASIQERCTPASLRDGKPVPNWRDLKPLTGWEYIKGQKTCDLYPIDKNLPRRFNNPLWFKGYGCETPSHPFYVTTSADYGRFSPNPHTMAHRFHPRFGKFTRVQGSGGMYRNRTLNTSNTKSVV